MEDDLHFLTQWKTTSNFNKWEDDLNLSTKRKTTLTFQQHGWQPQSYQNLKMTSNFKPIKDNLILINKIEEKNLGAKWIFKQAHFDLTLAQLSPSLFYGTTILILFCGSKIDVIFWSKASHFFFIYNLLCSK